MIAIIGAMEEEVAYFKANMDILETITKASFTFLVGSFSSKKIVVVKSGIGKTAAAVCTQCVIDTFNPSFIINTGIAGSLNDSLEIGDVVVGAEISYHDVDVTAFGYVKNQIPGAAVLFKSSNNLSKIAFKFGAKKGKIATGDSFIADDSLKIKIKDETNADLVDMESASIAHTATLNGANFIIIRSVSDKASSSANVDFKENIQVAVKSAIKITEELVKNV